MGRLFLKLYSILALAVVVFLVGIANITTLFYGPLEHSLKYLSQGTFYLLEQRLAESPPEAWPALIDEFNQGDGYVIRLVAMESLLLSKSMMDRLSRGEQVIYVSFETDYSYKRIQNSNWVIEFPFDETDYINSQRVSNSTFNLLEMSLQQQPQSSWPSMMVDISRRFDFPVVLLEQNKLELSPSQQLKLVNGEVVPHHLSEYDEVVYRHVSDSPYVIKMGPFEESLTIEYINTILILAFAFLVALAVLFWVYPLWRDLKQLGIRAKAFGQGDFSARAPLSQRSVLHRLAETFNSMASRIQNLIYSHKELTNAVSHELRTPISRLRFGMEMLQSSSEEASRLRYMSSMNSDIEELDQLVDELLTYARFDRDKPALTFQRQEVKPWLTEVIRQAQIGNNDLTIEFEIVGDEFKYARFEPKLLARALANLLQNAKRYAQTKTNVIFTHDDSYFQICVDDDGPGIPENERKHVFEAFKRLDASRDRDTGGYGLGLAIVQRISQWHGGDVVAKDSPLGGARFVIRWPEEDNSQDVN